MEKEMSDLMGDLSALPRMGAVRKINDMVKRIRQVKVLAIILDHLRKKMPQMFGKEKKKKEIMQNLPGIFREIMKLHELSPGRIDISSFAILCVCLNHFSDIACAIIISSSGHDSGDFPEIDKFKLYLEDADISAFPRIEGKKMNKGGRLDDLEVALKVAMPDLLNRLPGIATTKVEAELC